MTDRTTTTDPAYAAFADAQARLDDGIGTPEEQAADQRLTDAYDRDVLAPAQYEYERKAAAANAENIAHETGVYYDETDDTYGWSCSCDKDDPGYDSEDDDHDAAQQHEEENRG